MKRKGFTLVEVIVSSFLAIVILNISIGLVLDYYKIFNETITENIRMDALDDALLSIDNLLKGNMIFNIDILEDRNEISILYAIDHWDKTSKKQKIIKFDKNNKKIILETIVTENELISSKGVNNILLGVQDFFITKKGNIYYLNIKSENGDERIQCI